MPVDNRQYTLLWIPKTGLFYDGGGSGFTDGKGDTIRWDRTVYVFPSHQRAETAKQKMIDKYPDAKGEIVVLPIVVKQLEE